MAKSEKEEADQVVKTFNPTAMLDLPDEELEVGRGGGKRSNYSALTDEELELLHRKIKVNRRIIKAIEDGEINSARFHVIDDSPKVETLTKEFALGQDLTFTKDGERVTVPIKSFTEGGSQTYLKYEKNGREIKFKLTNISAKTDKGNKSLLQF